MSQGANKAFTSNPRSWLRQNVLLVDINKSIAATRDDGTKYMKMKYNEGVLIECDIIKSKSQSATSTGTFVPTWDVVEATGKASMFAHRFKAFYLPFRSNAIRTMQLSATQYPGGADFFFTDTINGCTVCAGPGGQPKVGHFNRTVGGDDGANIDQTAIDNDITNEFNGGTVMKLSKNTYKGGVGEAATILGVKWMGTWDFFWQKRDWVGAAPPSGKKFAVDLSHLNVADAFG